MIENAKDAAFLVQLVVIQKRHVMFFQIVEPPAVSMLRYFARLVPDRN